MGIRLTRRALPLALLMLVGVGAALAAGTSTKVTIRSAKVAGLGSVLVNAGGLTLYTHANKSSSCTGVCAATWPPLLVTGTAKPVAGAGLAASKIGTIKRGDGRVQVTYNGFALYRYSADKKAGDAQGQAVGGVWYAIRPSTGKLVKTALNPASTPSNNGSDNGTTSTNGGGQGGEMEPYPSMMSGAMN